MFVRVNDYAVGFGDCAEGSRGFGIKGVSGVFLGHDFVTVSRKDAEWQQLKPAVLGAIMDHYLSGAPVLAGGATGMIGLKAVAGAAPVTGCAPVGERSVATTGWAPVGERAGTAGCPVGVGRTAAMMPDEGRLLPRGGSVSGWVSAGGGQVLLRRSEVAGGRQTLRRDVAVGGRVVGGPGVVHGQGSVKKISGMYRRARKIFPDRL